MVMWFAEESGAPAEFEVRSVTGRMRSPACLARIAGLGLLALLTANCSGPIATRERSVNKYGVAASPKVIPDGQPIPKGGGRAMTGKPYVVGERTYVPHSGSGYIREGEASWYGTAFHGRLTANGEVFDKESIAAAHPTLPLPSYVRVTNLANRRSMIVRVNDRGPYERGRLIDLSERAAQALAFHRAGTTKVRVQYIGTASTGGSDDRKLLATLQGGDAPSGGSRAPIRLAALDEAGGRVGPPLAYKPLATTAVARDGTREGQDEATPAIVIAAVRQSGTASAFTDRTSVPADAQPESDVRTAATPSPMVARVDTRMLPATIEPTRPGPKGDRLAVSKVGAPSSGAGSATRGREAASVSARADILALPPARPGRQAPAMSGGQGGRRQVVDLKAAGEGRSALR